MTMKIVLSTRGSRGDVHPIIEIASALRRAGHDAVICVPRTFEHLARTRKLDYSLYSEDSGQVMQKLGSGMKAIQTALDSAGYPKSAAFTKPPSLPPPPLASEPSPEPDAAARAPEPDAAQQR